MALANYTDLQAAIADELARDDLTSKIPDFIKLAESEINRDLRVKEMREIVTINPSQSVNYTDLPDGFMELISFSDHYGEPVFEVVTEDLARSRYAASESWPNRCAIGARIEFDCVADASYDYTMAYWKRLDIEADTTNAVMTNHPDLYLYGSCLKATHYINDDERAGLWRSIYDLAVAKANRQSNRSTRKLRTDFTGQRFNINRGF